MTTYRVTVETRPIGAIGVFELRTITLEIDGNPSQLTIVNVALDAIRRMDHEPRFITSINPTPFVVEA